MNQCGFKAEIEQTIGHPVLITTVNITENQDSFRHCFLFLLPSAGNSAPVASVPVAQPQAVAPVAASILERTL